MNFPKPLLAMTLAALLASPAIAKEVAYVANEKDDTISVIDMDTMEVTDTIEVGDRPGN